MKTCDICGSEIKEYSWSVAMEAFSISSPTKIANNFYINKMCGDCFGATKAFFDLRGNLALRMEK